ncbi:hypothetical protein CTA2_2000 [Colletotrichum tanaceti]|nr:hypothetical protein CTA2_2000 [Colletotrichum tanaceti]
MGPGHLPDPRLFKSDKWRHRRLFERCRLVRRPRLRLACRGPRPTTSSSLG